MVHTAEVQTWFTLQRFRHGSHCRGSDLVHTAEVQTWFTLQRFRSARFTLFASRFLSTDQLELQLQVDAAVTEEHGSFNVVSKLFSFYGLDSCWERPASPPPSESLAANAPLSS